MEAFHDSEHITRVIFEYAARIGHEQEMNSILNLNADMARDLVGADRCSIWLLDAAANELYTTVAHCVEEIRVPVGYGLVGACVAEGRPVVVNDTSEDARFHDTVDQSSGYITKSILVIPLRTMDGAVIGAFQALNKPGGFSEADITLLGLAASYSASAVETQKWRAEAEKGRIMLRELEIARDVQARLMPRTPPRLERLDCAWFFRPAKFVGGDYFDFIETPDGGLAFTLGDVSGKGIPAALLMASVQASLRIPLLRGPDSLKDLLRDLNSSVYESLSATKYSTLFLGLIDAGRTRITYVNAGHCPPMLVRRGLAGATIHRLKLGGTPIGLLPIADFTEGVVDLEPGDLLLCYSDGISEATNIRNEFWDEREIEKILLASGNIGARELTELVIGRVEAFMGPAEQSDDITIVSLRVC